MPLSLPERFAPDLLLRQAKRAAILEGCRARSGWCRLHCFVLVLLTFYMKEMVPLRAAALCSNVAFLIYGGLLHLTPIVLLHGALIPINVCRLVSALRASSIEVLPDDAVPDVGPGFLELYRLHGGAVTSATSERPTAPT